MSDNANSDFFWDAQLRALFECSLDAVIACDDHGAIVAWSHRAAETFGWSREEALGRELAELIVPVELRDAHRAGLEQFRKTGATRIVGQRLRLTALRRDGRQLPIELSVAKIERQGHSYFVGYVRDVSDWERQERKRDRKLLEAELLHESTVEVVRSRTVEDSLQSILDAISEQIDWPVGHVWIPSDSGKRLVSSHIWHLQDPDRLASFRVATERLKFGPGRGLPGLIWTSGKPRWIADVSTTQSFPRAEACVAAGLQTVFGFPVSCNGELQAVLEFFHTEYIPEDEELLAIVGRLGKQIGDLVQRRRFEQQQARLAAIVGSSYDAIIGKDLDGTITDWNQGAERTYGYTEEEAVGSPISIILPTDLPQEEPEIVHAVRTGQRLEQFQTIRCRKDGMLIPVSLTVSPILDRAGRTVGSSTIERDITGRQQRERELHTAREAAVRANRARGEFLANVSHELRTPMNAIIGMAQLALEEDLSPAVHDYVTTANEAAHALLTLLNDILDFSKIESGKFTINKEPFSIAETVEDTVRTISAQAFAQGLELLCEFPADLPRVVIGDSVRLRQILTNLLSNAIKFTHQGEIVLKVDTVRVWPTEIRLRFSVRDTGIGIPPEDQRRILEPFTQVDSSSTRQQGGTGLGLAICAELLRMMGGRLALNSAPGEGSTFTFRLSFDLPSEASKESVDELSPEHRNLPVLVVDDSPTNRRIVTQALKGWSLRPTSAQNADRAIAAFQRAAADGQPFPLVILDAVMPGMDGLELASKLAQESAAAAPAVILMVSSQDRRDFRERDPEASPYVHLQKPITQSDLKSAVMRALEVQPGEPVEKPFNSSSGAPLAPLSVLVAEDTPANQKVVTSMLKKRGHAVTIARNGLEAVELYKQAHFDVVLMDVQMPILDGFQATAAIREFDRESRSSAPVIAMTAHAMRGDREKCLEAGMDAYVAKPLDVRQLLGLVESIAEDWQVPSEGGAAVFGTTDQPILDYAGAMRRLADDEQLYREFVGFFDEDAPQLSARIEAAVKLTDASELQRAAHSLKGLAANLGATGVTETARRIEENAQRGLLDTSAEDLERLRQEMSRLDGALQQFRN